MFIFYNKENGRVVFNMEGESYPPHLANDEVGVISTLETITDLSCWQVVEGELVKFTIDPIKARYQELVRVAVSDKRSLFITNLPGQDMIYLRKEQEAIAYVADTNPDLANYPLIAAEVGITAPTAYEVAQVWLYMSNAWKTIAAPLEAIRLTAVNAINASVSETEVENAYADFLSAMDFIQ